MIRLPFGRTVGRSFGRTGNTSRADGAGGTGFEAATDLTEDETGLSPSAVSKSYLPID